MALVNSLLTAIIRADGDALVMHVGERPYGIGDQGEFAVSAASNAEQNIEPIAASVPEPAPEPMPIAASIPQPAPEPLPIAASIEPPPQMHPSVVLPMTRSVRIEVPPRTSTRAASGIDRLLRIAAARGASALFLTSDSRP